MWCTHGHLTSAAEEDRRCYPVQPFYYMASISSLLHRQSDSHNDIFPVPLGEISTLILKVIPKHFKTKSLTLPPAAVSLRKCVFTGADLKI